MATININAKCDLNKPVVVRHLDGMVFSQDVKANMIRVSVFRDREPVDLSGGSVSANIIRADGATVVQTGTIEGNICSVVLPSSAYAVPGQIAIFVKHSTSAGPTTSTIAAITGYVYKSTTDTIVDPGSVVPNVNQLLAMIEDCEEATEACIAATAAAPVVDDTAGAGDTNKVWSADKSAGEAQSLTTEINSKADKTVTDALHMNKAPVIIDSATGNPIVLTDGAEGLPVEGMKIHFLPVQDLHGLASPYPAGASANVWDEDWEIGLINLTTGENASSSTQIRAKGYIPVQPNTEYYNVGVSKWMLPYGSDKVVLQGQYMSQLTSGNASSISGNASFTTPADCYYLRFYLNPEYGTTYKNDQGINYPSTDHDYHPYSNICPIEGWTGVTPWRSGLNLLNSLENGAYKTADGEAIGSGSYVRMPKTAICPGAVISVSANVTSVTCLYWDKTGNYIGYKEQSVAQNRHFTIPENAFVYAINFYQQGGITVDTAPDIMVNFGSDFQAYTPYTGQSFPVMFPALGKNLIDINIENLERGSIAGATGNNESSTNRVRTKAMYPFPFDSIYDNGYVLTIPTGYKIAMRFYAEDGSFIAMASGQVGFITSLPSSVYGKGAKYARFIFARTDDANITVEEIAQTTYQLERGSTATPYEPYTSTVYGGTVYPLDGVMLVEWAKFVATSSAIRRNDGNRWYIPNMYTNSIIPQADTANAVISNVFKSETGGQYDDRCFINSSGAIRFNTSTEYESISALLSAIPEMEFVFLLATPIEIPLDPITTIQTLLGYNTIWSDANGTIELDYRADTKLFIAKNKQDIRATIAPIEDGTTASKAYSAGKLFYHDGNLCKAKTSIASGATFTLNTNYEITTVADELFVLN